MVDQSKLIIKPLDQEELTEEELKIEHTRILTAKNPLAPDNHVTYSFVNREFEEGPAIRHVQNHFINRGTLFHRECDEGQAKIAEEIAKEEAEAEESARESRMSVRSSVAGRPSVASRRSTVRESVAAAPSNLENLINKPKKPAKNQFNYQERDAQSGFLMIRNKLSQTDPPPRVDISDTVSPSVIYDFYQEHLKKLEAEKAAAAKKPAKQVNKKEPVKKEVVVEHVKKDLSDVTARKVERMLNQNSHDQLADDFKYFDDPNDSERTEGSLLPLWRFQYEKTKRMAVTSMAWCPGTDHDDVFVVGYGSFDYAKQGKGYLVYFSMKNPSYPEGTVPSPSGIMCLSVNPKKGNLVACGLYDGSVALFDYKEKNANPLIQTVSVKRHGEPVWDLKWMTPDESGRGRFCSISTDGKLRCWTQVKNELVGTSMLEFNEQGSGMCIDFHPQNPKIYLCGTEEGMVHKCTTEYSSKYLYSSEAHAGGVMVIKWNPFHEDVYATCGQDWTLKLWNQVRPELCLMSFDLGASVNDLDWAPYSSTVLAAITEGDNARAFVYDLSQNKYNPLCYQGVSTKKKTRLTRVLFNKSHRILLISNDRGSCTSFKLSPNLRKVPVKSKKDPTPLPVDPAKEREKIGKVALSMMDGY